VTCVVQCLPDRGLDAELMAASSPTKNSLPLDRVCDSSGSDDDDDRDILNILGSAGSAGSSMKCSKSMGSRSTASS